MDKFLTLEDLSLAMSVLALLAIATVAKFDPVLAHFSFELLGVAFALVFVVACLFLVPVCLFSIAFVSIFSNIVDLRGGHLGCLEGEASVLEQL